MSLSGLREPLNCITDVRETTRKALHLSHFIDQLIGHAIGEEFLRGVMGQVFQGKHRDGLKRGDFGSCCGDPGP